MATYGSSKSTVLAVCAEVTAGTPVDPTAGTEYLAVQPDLQMSPNFEVLSNDEIRSSIGESKGIQGLESPEGSLSHYMKHSGTEGTTPEFDLLLKSLMGSTSANGTQRLTAAACTTTLIKMAAGGSDMARGKAFLIKDGTNGYAIRNVLSMATNDATIAFALTAAPAAGVGLGKCVNFAPANEGHPSLTFHRYGSNGLVYDAISGALVDNFSMSVQAGQMINSNFGFKGTKYFFNPIRITSSDIKLDFTDSTPGTFAATITAKLYRDPHELAQAIQDAMNAVGAVDTYTVTYMNNDPVYFGKFKITSSGTVFTMTWNTGVNTANSVGDKIGFSLASNDTGALTYYSDSVLSWASPYTPSYDSTDPIAAKYLEILLGASSDSLCFCAQSVQIQIQNVATDVKCICAESGVDSKKITKRTVTVTISALLDKHEADRFRRFRANSDTAFAFNFGTRSGGNWEAGKCGNVYIPSCSVVSYNLTELDDLIAAEIQLKGFVDSSGNGEVYFNFL